MLSVRVITVDHYTSKLIPELCPRSNQTSKQWQEPVIRIFGPTPSGVKTCVHVHGVYPYMYVPYRGGENPERDALLLGTALDQALLTQVNQKFARFVYKVILVSGIPLYGYHSKHRQFFKIYFFNPHHIKKASDLLLSGAILGQKLQPHEAHIPYTLQFMMDYNIYGMSFIDLAKVKYRRDPENQECLAGIKEEDKLPLHVKKITRSYWEVDVLAEDILNREQIGKAGGNPGLKAIWDDEKARRRAQDRHSQITPQSSQSRPNVEITASEILYKERLANKLKDIHLEERGLIESGSDTLGTYPAEVPEKSDILEASIIDLESPKKSSDMKMTGLEDLVDEKILSQMVSDDTDSENENAKIEEDSVLGRNQGDEEEAESENSDGGDMTQPLDQDENVMLDSDANLDERGKSGTEDDEEEFWRNMADKILQLDGADDSLSGSDEDSTPGNCSKATEDAVDRMLSNQSPGMESMSNWSSNIMSLLSEPGGFPTPQSAYQTPQTFWSSWSPRIPQTDTVWSQNHSDNNWLLDCVSSDKTPNAFSTVPFNEERDSNDLYPLNSNQGEYFHGNYTPASTMSPMSNVGSVYAIPPPSAILTPASEMDCYSDVNLDSVSQISNSPPRQEETQKICVKSSSLESKVVTVQKKETIRNNLRENERKLINTLKNFRPGESKNKKMSLTLKQYLKSCGDIVSVDFKNINGKEMVVIEYKPINSSPNKNKFLIKPLGKFLEEWEQAEKKVNESAKIRPKLINGFTSEKEDSSQLNAVLNTLENKYTGAWLDKSKIKNIKNKFVVKSVEMLPDNPSPVINNKKIFKSENDDKYKVNENVISDGKIKMKLVKSPHRTVSDNCNDEGGGGDNNKKVHSRKSNLDREKRLKHKNELGNRSKGSRNLDVNENRLSYSKATSLNQIVNNKSDCLKKYSSACDNDNTLARTKKNNKKVETKGPSSVDLNLVRQINNSFEDYFRNMIKINHLTVKNIKEEDNESSCLSSEDSEDEKVTEKSDNISKSKNDSFCENSNSNLEPVKFVSQLLTAFSCLSNSNNKIPPVSITINFGNPTNSNTPSVPIQLNFQSGGNSSRAKSKIDNVDGPADSSSSENSDFEASPVVKTPSKKRTRKSATYKPLDVVVQKSPKLAKRDSDESRSRKRKATKNLSEAIAGSSSTADVPPVFSIDCSDGSKLPTNDRPKILQPDLRPNPEEEISAKNLTRLGGTDLANENRVTEEFEKSDSLPSNEPDVIEDSDSDKDTPLAKKLRKLKVDEKMRKLGLKSRLSYIPQTDVFISSSDDEEKRKPVKKVRYVILESDETSKSSTPPCPITPAVQEINLVSEDEEDATESLDKGIVSFYDKTSFNLLETSEDSGDVTIIERQESRDTEKSFERCFTQKMPTTPSQGFPSRPIAVNSDDSIKLSEGFSQKSQISSPFELSGAMLLVEDADDTLKEDSVHSSPLRLSGVESLPDSVKSEETQSNIIPNLNPPVNIFTLSDSSADVPAEDSPQISRTLLGEDFGSDDLFESPRTVTSFSIEPAADFTKPATFVPKTKPPTIEEVKSSLVQYGIPETLAQIPFYSNPSDISKPMEIGCRLLKIENYSIAGLKTHKSSLDVLGTEERRNLNLNFQKKGNQSLRSALITDREIVLKPLKRPPPLSEVVKWSKTKTDKKEEKQEESAKKKILMPASPDQDSGSDDDLSLTLTPNVTDESVVATPDSEKKTPRRRVSFNDSTSSSPVLDKSFPRHSTPNRTSESVFLPEGEIKLKKGPLSKIKGILKKTLMGKLQAIAEERAEPAVEPRETVQIRENPQQLSGESDKKSDSSSKDMFGDEKTPTKSSNESIKRSVDNSFQIQGVTWNNTYGFHNSVEFLQNAKAVHDHQYVTMLVMEVHVQTRGELRPDPQHDPIRAIFYTLTCDGPTFQQETGIIVVGENMLKGTGITVGAVHHVPDEASLFQKMIEFIRLWDPDILAGYEIEMHSWGYLIQRGYVFETNLLTEIGRTNEENPSWKEANASDSQNLEFDDAPKNIRHMRIPGRIILDIWRLLRHEVALTSYTFENVMYHLTHERLPSHSYKMLSHCWEHKTHRLRHITVEYYLTRVEGVVRLLDQLDFINRNSELARLFGIQFYEVLSRGSQFRVESMMLRLAKPLNYVPCSPSVRQRANMRAPASLPLIMEPESMFYADPVIVLDFQSLYPSMIIAYNYCFSTCLGRVELLGGREPFEFGCTRLQISPEELKSLENDINISPAGVAFVKQNIRKGVLPRMLEEILETRLMVKKSMKENKKNKLLQKVLHARQLGLKLIANVTYGYTAANFSGRMPCIEVGDSVVSKGRETLQRAIQLVKNTPRWGAKVIYGDTDSLFVLTPGKSRKEAFKIGAEIADVVTESNPKPVKLKLEKIYQPCILQTKKRYVGYMYESADQEKPVYDAKGIETVRRDGCPATAKVLQKALQILFETKDVSLVKKYTVRQFTKLFQGRVNIQDLIFAKEYRGRDGYRPGACVPALQLAKQWTQVDKRAEPRKKERVPYVIVNGPPGVPLIRLVRSPRDLILDPSLRINAAYYITKAIVPPMQRCFSLLGADVMSWYSEMPRKYHRVVRTTGNEHQKKSTISQYFATVECVVCSEITNTPVCQKCQGHPQKLAVVLNEKTRHWERTYDNIIKVCESCCGRKTATDCTSLDCPILFRRCQAFRDLNQVPVLRQIVEDYLHF